ncbi:transcriptional regulator NrdR [Candidatus Peregrinibacteria bacterium]|nr:MAG: transcriptional regulator NrdR [Candidatus Peregrinibacteria bacterium]
MICPQCKADALRVLESRDTDAGISIRRRRECLDCAFRFTTFERVETSNFFVKKRNGDVILYNRGKLLQGLYRAVVKRNIQNTDLEAMVTNLEMEWMAKGKEISSKKMGDDVMEKLKDIDEVAYIRFASVYHDFQDVKSFLEALKNI